jgi:transposase
MEAKKSHKRRRYSPELKDQILAECDAPGASVAKVAMSLSINANILHGWHAGSSGGETRAARGFFVMGVGASQIGKNQP